MKLGEKKPEVILQKNSLKRIAQVLFVWCLTNQSFTIFRYTTQWELSNGYGSNPAVIVQPAWPPHVVTTTAEQNPSNPHVNGEIQYEIIETHEVAKPSTGNFRRVITTMQPSTAIKI